jgi:hypothetical protein
MESGAYFLHTREMRPLTTARPVGPRNAWKNVELSLTIASFDRPPKKMKEIIEDQPEDATYEGTVRELAFAGVVEWGLGDVREGRVISKEEMGKRIRLRRYL